MKLFGIPLRKPTFNEVTAATIMAVGLWLACLGGAAAFGVAGGQQHVGALAGQLQGLVEADAGVGAGHHDALAGKAEGGKIRHRSVSSGTGSTSV